MSIDDYDHSSRRRPDEMAILDVFIKTIFQPQSRFNAYEEKILAALRRYEKNLGSVGTGALSEHLHGLSPARMKTTVLGVMRQMGQIDE